MSPDQNPDYSYTQPSPTLSFARIPLKHMKKRPPKNAVPNRGERKVVNFMISLFEERASTS